VKSVKERELPELDDEFAQLASEFDTIDELQANLEDQVRRVKRIQQAEQIRDKALERLLEQIEVPLPEAVVQGQVDQTLHNALHGLDHDEERFAQALEEQGTSREQFDADARQNAEKAVKTQLLVDTIADVLEVEVGQDDLTERLVLQSRQYGIEPQQLLQFLQENNQLPAMFADVRRGKALAALVSRSTVKDTDGNVVDTDEYFGARNEDALDEALEEVPAEALEDAADEADEAEQAAEGERR
jgi:trigger factor